MSYNKKLRRKKTRRKKYRPKKYKRKKSRRKKYKRKKSRRKKYRGGGCACQDFHKKTYKGGKRKKIRKSMKGGNCSLLGGCSNRPIQSWDIGNRLTGIPLNKNVMPPPINTNNIKGNQLGGGKIMNSIGLGHLSRMGHSLEDSIYNFNDTLKGNGVSKFNEGDLMSGHGHNHDK